MLTCIKKLNKWNFEKKMRGVVSLAISGTSILVLVRLAAHVSQGCKSQIRPVVGRI